LAVLSACDTAVTSSRQLETGNSLARAFLVAGATRVVASFWKVNDPSTCELMSTLYREIDDQKQKDLPVNYAEGLRKAMLSIKAMRSSEKGGDDWSSPYYWAPFALIGPADARPAPVGLDLQARN